MTRTITIAFACAAALTLGATAGFARDGGERAAAESSTAWIAADASGGRNATPRAPRDRVVLLPATPLMVAVAGTTDAGRNGCPRGACRVGAE